ncbi:Hypothetical predicted protein [Cloeon dipterum]|uniref:dTCF n=1 Tax=Cloeon dipterum TaxID=197152 RepID=A0A8S1DUG1_9INSE|nr:Hypothetical predicted protein [Cloeon dipterum]
MPHVSAASSAGDDLGSTDEVKVFKDEGGADDDEKRSPDNNLSEEKNSLIDLTESQEKSQSSSFSPKSNAAPRSSDLSPVFGKVDAMAQSALNMGYLVGPYHYPNGSTGHIPVTMTGKIGLASSTTGLPFFCHNGEHLTQPPPAHMGIPPYQLDTKGTMGMSDYWRAFGMVAAAASGSQVVPPPPVPTPASRCPSLSPSLPPSPRLMSRSSPAPGPDWKRLLASGLARPSVYPFGATQYSYPILSPDMSQVASWHSPSMYPTISSASAGFRSPYPSSLPTITSTSEYFRFSPTGLIPPHPGLSPHHLASHPAIVTPGPKQEVVTSEQPTNHSVSRRSEQKGSTGSASEGGKSQESSSQALERKKPHIKKPLNAFMLYMKEMRAKVVAECTLKESAAINQILGRRWHGLSRDEQAKYYEKARQERQLHMQLYPGWSARDNYGYGTKKKKRKKEKTVDGGTPPPATSQKHPHLILRKKNTHLPPLLASVRTLMMMIDDDDAMRMRYQIYVAQIQSRAEWRVGLGGVPVQWHALGREEQAKYYELARRERQLHMQLYPDWSSRSNASRGKKRKRKQEHAGGVEGGNNMKKCRARYGLEQQSQWCKPCSPAEGSISSGSGAATGSLHGGGATAQEPTYVNL